MAWWIFHTVLVLRRTRRNTLYPVQEVIGKAKASKSIGPAGISMLILKHLGPEEADFKDLNLFLKRGTGTFQVALSL